MLNHAKSVSYGSSLFLWLFSFVFVGKLAPLGAVFRTLVLWRWRCLSQFSGKREFRAVGSIRSLILGFSVLSAKVQSLIFKNYELFQFFGFWLLFVS